jgi:hypothetical protein
LSKRLLQINFTFSVSIDELDELALGRSLLIKDVAGLEWKNWLMNEKENVCAGHYLFSDEISMNDYLNSPFMKAMKNNPTISDISIKSFSIMTTPTVNTRGPV